MSADKKYFTLAHIEANRFNASAELAEEAVHCLELVAELVNTGLRFQFKGGNSLLLILPEPKRFSIDVDIATGESREKIEESLQVLISRFGIFRKWEKRQHKTKPWLPIASYYLFFDSTVLQGEKSVMLDVQLRLSPYKTGKKPVVCGKLYASDALVDVPLPASIIGDKLLTLGPNTLGIPIGKGKEAQRLKHVFDVSRLLTARPLLSDIRESFAACHKHENELQDRGKGLEETVADTIAFCRSVAGHEEMPEDRNLAPILSENVRGLPVFARHLFDAGYSWKELRRDMDRVAVCMQAVGDVRVSDEQFSYLMDSR